MEDWDIISPKDVIGSEQLFAERTRSLATAALPFTQSLLSQVLSLLPSPIVFFSHRVFNLLSSTSWAFHSRVIFTCVQVGRTLSRVQQAFSWSYGEEIKPFKPPLSDAEFHSYLNGQGQLTRPEELRLRIYHGGVEPSLRKVYPQSFNTIFFRIQIPFYVDIHLICIL